MPRSVSFFFLFLGVLACRGWESLPGAEPTASPKTPTTMRPNMTGAYGPWLADRVLGEGPARMSFRTGNWPSVDAWRAAARKRVGECLAPVDLGGVPAVRVDWQGEYDGLRVERLSWQLPCGPRTEAVFLKPLGAQGRLPAILALHDHGGKKFLGWRKIARTDDKPWEVQAKHQEDYYGGAAWANEIAKRGYAVLVHDTFPFASRRVLAQDVPRRIRGQGVDPDPADAQGIDKYNQFAGEHEHIMEKSLLSAGTTWPGVYAVEDMRALDVLCARPDVDASRVGCAGLSGGGMRTVFLGGLDDRIRCAVAVGFMTTWRDFLLDKCFTHTWMTYVPLLPRDLDFPEILALRAPAATMVLNCWDDPLYTPAEMKRADAMIRETFQRAGASEKYKCVFYPGGHKFDRPMQKDAFEWFDRHLREKPCIVDEVIADAVRLVRLPDGCAGSELIYENRFSAGAEASRVEAAKDWVLEGGGVAQWADGYLRLRAKHYTESRSKIETDHFVYWLRRDFPADLAVEWDFRFPDWKINPNGLAILFFCAQGAGGEDLFDPGLSRRDGIFDRYHSGDVRSYHTSYFAGRRGSANLRKNPGFHLVASGKDLVAERGPDRWHRLRLTRFGAAIELSVDGRRSITWTDDGQTHGPIHGGGKIGFRQQNDLFYGDYTNVRVYRLDSRPEKPQKPILR